MSKTWMMVALLVLCVNSQNEKRFNFFHFGRIYDHTLLPYLYKSWVETHSKYSLENFCNLFTSGMYFDRVNYGEQKGQHFSAFLELIDEGCNYGIPGSSDFLSGSSYHSNFFRSDSHIKWLGSNFFIMNDNSKTFEPLSSSEEFNVQTVPLNNKKVCLIGLVDDQWAKKSDLSPDQIVITNIVEAVKKNLQEAVEECDLNIALTDLSQENDRLLLKQKEADISFSGGSVNRELIFENNKLSIKSNPDNSRYSLVSVNIVRTCQADFVQWSSESMIEMGQPVNGQVVYKFCLSHHHPLQRIELTIINITPDMPTDNARTFIEARVKSFLADPVHGHKVGVFAKNWFSHQPNETFNPAPKTGIKWTEGIPATITIVENLFDYLGKNIYEDFVSDMLQNPDLVTYFKPHLKPNRFGYVPTASFHPIYKFLVFSEMLRQYNVKSSSEKWALYSSRDFSSKEFLDFSYYYNPVAKLIANIVKIECEADLSLLVAADFKKDLTFTDETYISQQELFSSIYNMEDVLIIEITKAELLRLAQISLFNVPSAVYYPQLGIISGLHFDLPNGYDPRTPLLDSYVTLNTVKLEDFDSSRVFKLATSGFMLRGEYSFDSLIKKPYSICKKNTNQKLFLKSVFEMASESTCKELTNFKNQAPEAYLEDIASALYPEHDRIVAGTTEPPETVKLANFLNDLKQHTPYSNHLKKLMYFTLFESECICEDGKCTFVWDPESGIV